MNTWHIITKENVERESYYNLVRLCALTGYANPIAALGETGETIAVVKDVCGNILRRT